MKLYIYLYNKLIFTYTCVYILFKPLIRISMYGYNNINKIPYIPLLDWAFLKGYQTY